MVAMHRALWILTLSLVLVRCAHEEYPPAVPARPYMDLAEHFRVAARPADGACPPPTPAPRLVSLTPEEWDLYRKVEPPTRGQKGKRGPAGASMVATPTTTNTVGGMVRYTYIPNTVYTIPVTTTSTAALFLPPGELPTAPPALNTDEKVAPAFALGATDMGTKEDRQGVLFLRGLYPGQKPSTTPIVFKSGLVIFLKVVTVEDSPLLGFTWDLSLQPRPEPEVPVAQRPPKLDMARIFRDYEVKVTSKYPPPWLPTEVFDDGTMTLLRLPADGIKGTRLPGIAGVNQTGGAVLVQAHLWTSPDGTQAMFVVQGIFPAVTLKDAAGLAVKIVRGSAPPAEAMVGQRDKKRARPVRKTPRPALPITTVHQVLGHE
jgi:type IV secretory pathway VirB9-like protein